MDTRKLCGPNPDGKHAILNRLPLKCWLRRVMREDPQDFDPSRNPHHHQPSAPRLASGDRRLASKTTQPVRSLRFGFWFCHWIPIWPLHNTQQCALRQNPGTKSGAASARATPQQPQMRSGPPEPRGRAGLLYLQPRHGRLGCLSRSC